MITIDLVGKTVKEVGARFDGFSGNCARFAVILNRVLGGEGDYVLVDGGHYEFVDHVLLRYDGCLLDASGLVAEEDLEAMCDDGETVEDFHDASADGESVRCLVDSANPFAARWDDAALEAALGAALAEAGFVPVAMAGTDWVP